MTISDKLKEIIRGGYQILSAVKPFSWLWLAVGLFRHMIVDSSDGTSWGVILFGFFAVHLLYDFLMLWGKVNPEVAFLFGQGPRMQNRIFNYPELDYREDEQSPNARAMFEEIERMKETGEIWDGWTTIHAIGPEWIDITPDDRLQIWSIRDCAGFDFCEDRGYVKVLFLDKQGHFHKVRMSEKQADKFDSNYIAYLRDRGSLPKFKSTG